MTPLTPFSGVRWQLLLEPQGRPGYENMAVDEALLAEAARSGAAFLRLYRWAPACLSFGRNEPALARYDRAAIERRGIDVVRRPTGGRAVWHEYEVTYAVAAPVAAFGSLGESYRLIHERLARALRGMGVNAELASADSSTRSSAPSGPCFAMPVGGEVIVDGKKVVGSAQVRQGSGFLQHGSILLAGSQDLVGAVSRRPASVTAATTLSEILGRMVGFDEVADAIVGAWPDGSPGASSIHLTACPPDPADYRDASWTWRR